MNPAFTDSILGWFSQHGRKTLPWQSDRDPYKVWISEIMLQQTQVETVIPYFFKFIDQFPNIESLANASHDQVMRLWAGLGYYARARNLHKSAQIICDNHDCSFPSDFNDVIALPGIGKSTAGAILAFCFNQRHPILDGNVKRVLARHFAVEGYPGKKVVENNLWSISNEMTPVSQVADYTQAIMDMGATVCTRSKPRCSQCPIQQSCVAYAEDSVDRYPGRKAATIKRQKSVRMLIIKNDLDEVLLYKRPPTGIWGGLWSLPEIEDADKDLKEWITQNLSIQVSHLEHLDVMKHGFSHYDLIIQPILCRSIDKTLRVMDADRHLWYNVLDRNIGVPAAVQRIFDKIYEDRIMSRMVNCAKLGIEAEGLEHPTWPGDLGKRIFDEVSKEAWQEWLRQQTILINEYKLNPLDREHKKYLSSQMEAYFFGDGIVMPDAWKSEK